MPAPYFSTNANDWPALEGLYVSERDAPAQVVGVNQNTAGVTATAVRGPVNTKVSIGSEARFLQVFGGRDRGSGGALASNLWKTLIGKKFGNVVCIRACAAAAATATRQLLATATNVVTVAAANPGLWGNDITVAVTAATNGDANYWNLTVTYLGTDYVLKNLLTTAGNDNTASVLADMWDEDAQLITLTKASDGRPDNLAASAVGNTVAGTDGTIADSDFTAANGPMEQLANASGVSIVWVGERSNSAIKDKWETLAASSSDRLFLISPDANTTSSSTAITEAASYRSDRIVYCFNHPYAVDPTTSLQISTNPESWMASILSQTEVDKHVIDNDNKALLVGIKDLYSTSYSRSDYVSLRAAGISALYRDGDGSFSFRSGRTTSLTPGKEEIARRRMADYLILSLADGLKSFVGEKSTDSNRRAIIAKASTFLEDLKTEERIVDDYQQPTFVETAAQRAAGTNKLLVRVRILSHILSLVLDTEIGTGVETTELAA